MSNIENKATVKDTLKEKVTSTASKVIKNSKAKKSSKIIEPNFNWAITYEDGNVTLNNEKEDSFEVYLDDNNYRKTYEKAVDIVKQYEIKTIKSGEEEMLSYKDKNIDNGVKSVTIIDNKNGYDYDVLWDDEGDIDSRDSLVITTNNPFKIEMDVIWN